MALDTFMTTLDVWIDDWYKAELAERWERRHGPKPQMSDSEVLTVAVAGQWRCGVPWHSERTVVQYMRRQGRGWFPHMLERSRFNERVRHLWAAINQLQQALAEVLKASQALYEVVDCLPLPSCSNAQSLSAGHWLWWGRRAYPRPGLEQHRLRRRAVHLYRTLTAAVHLHYLLPGRLSTLWLWFGELCWRYYAASWRRPDADFYRCFDAGRRVRV